MLILDDVSPIQRIKLTSSLAQAVKALAEIVSPLERIKLARKVADILAMLGAAIAPPKTLRFSLADKTGSSIELSRYLDGGLGLVPAPLQSFEAYSVATLADTLGDIELRQKARNAVSLNSMQGIDEAYRDAFDEIASRGVKVSLDAAEVLRKVNEADAVLRSSVAKDPEWQALQAAVSDLNTKFVRERDALTDRRKAEMGAIRAGERNGDDDLRGVESQLVELIEAYKAEFADLAKKAEGRKATFNSGKTARALELFRVEGEAVIGAVLAASPITQAEAEEWASKQVIDKSAAAKLSRLGYKKDDVVRDMAEFYRLSGGKSSAIRISTDGGRRANAVGIDARLGEKVINLGANFNKTVLFHELAHHLENDPIAKAASNGFLLKRRDSEQAHTLRSLTGNKGYSADEVAYKDSFMDPYIGKIYRDGITEVFSMGVQYLANPKDAAIFAAKDPQMFAMITGYLTSELTPAMSAKLHMHAGAVDEIQAERAGKASSYDAALKLLADQVTITKDDWWERTEGNSYEAQSLASYYFDRKKPPTYLGSFGDYKLFEGLFKNRNTKRNANGHMIVTDRMGRLDSQAVHGGLDAAKAFITLTEQTGLTLSGVWYGYFWDTTMKDAKAAVISAAQSVAQGKAE